MATAVSKNGRPLRAVTYCRTSGEGQRDNTSIPNQKSSICDFVDANEWAFVRHYVDECKSGSKIAGRDAFQQMMRDAAKGEFDIVVVYDISRYARDGSDIIESARTLKRDFGVHVVDIKGNVDTRDHRRTLNNFVQAGMAEADRLGIMERTIKGRIATAREGEPWTSIRPVGRDYDRKRKCWYVTERGKAIAAVLERYVEGENLKPLCKEYGLIRTKIYFWVANSQLAGSYHATFHAPEIGIENFEVPVPGMPEVVSQELLEKVKARLKFNRTHNRTDAKQYLLTGFLRCGCCGRALSGKTQERYRYVRYRHHGGGADYANCDFYSVLGRDVEGPILDYLYNQFLDEPAFSAAVERALPSPEQRQNLVNERHQTERRLKKNQKEAERLVAAIRRGAKVTLLLEAQDQLEQERETLEARLKKLDSRIVRLPSPESTRQAAMLMRIRLIEKYRGRDWRKLSTDEVKRFLLHLFGDSDDTAGISIRKDERGRLVAEFKGQVAFYDRLVDGRPISSAFEGYCDAVNNRIETLHNLRVRAIEEEYRKSKRRHVGKAYAANT